MPLVLLLVLLSSKRALHWCESHITHVKKHKYHVTKIHQCAIGVALDAVEEGKTRMMPLMMREKNHRTVDAD